ncbi:Queuine tRNA-ribosyltransferase subunit qtrtd1 [Kappamyces sp. JEL0829]|nr:Queuine tRNA-ribosyltransferase subunit qtrtd1 [Kappamyces sp. JEL0829]
MSPKIPPCLTYTRQAAIPHIVHSWSEQNASLLVSVEHFIDLISPSLAPSSKKSPETMGKMSKNIYEYCSIPSSLPVVASTCEVVRARRKADWAPGSQKALGFVANGGNRVLTTPTMLAETVKLLCPSVCLLADPALRLYTNIHDPNAEWTDSSESQERKAHKRWIHYLECTIKELPASLPLWICVGGSRREGIKHSTLHIKEAFHDRVAGYGIVLPSLGLLESVDPLKAEQIHSRWRDNLRCFVEHAPDSKPKILLGAASFSSVLEAISCGIDVVDDAWVEELSVEGRALFASLSPLDPVEGNPRIQQLDRCTRVFDLTPVGKRSEGRGGQVSFVRPVEEWKADVRVLDETCGCWTCQRGHTRAYIHHLLCVNDMLAYVLLHHHNLWVVHRFVDAAVAARNKGELGALIK